jgi:hypothetical protein
MPSTSIVLNDFGELTKRQSKKKDGSLGAVRYSATIDASPVVTRFDAKLLGKGPADAIAKHLRERVSGISAEASPATLKIRANDAKRLTGSLGGERSGPVKQSEWLRQRYAPVKKSASPPNQSTKMFNDSGRLAKGIAVGAAKGNAWIINVPATRFNPTTLNGGEAALAKVYARLLELVPEFGDARKLRDVLSVRRAIKQATPLIDPRLAGDLKKAAGKFLNQDISLRQIVDGIETAISLVG